MNSVRSYPLCVSWPNPACSDTDTVQSDYWAKVMMRKLDVSLVMAEASTKERPGSPICSPKIQFCKLVQPDF